MTVSLLAEESSSAGEATRQNPGLTKGAEVALLLGSLLFGRCGLLLGLGLGGSLALTLGGLRLALARRALVRGRFRSLARALGGALGGGGRRAPLVGE